MSLEGKAGVMLGVRAVNGSLAAEGDLGCSGTFWEGTGAWGRGQDKWRVRGRWGQGEREVSGWEAGGACKGGRAERGGGGR